MEALRIVFEDDHLLVVDKPAGLLTSTVPREKRPTLLAMVREYIRQTCPRSQTGLIHRLDRDAAGLLVFSKNHQAYESLKRQFFTHAVRRIYMAVVAGKLEPPSGKIESRLVEYVDGTVHRTKRGDSGELAITEYKTIRQLGALGLVRVKLHTGRKHQIRVHLSMNGAPIVGDSVYGLEKQYRKPPLMLCAVELGFRHPATDKAVKFAIPLPQEMRKLMQG